MCIRDSLKKSQHVGDVRGLGLLAGVELVADVTTRAPFAPEKGVAEKVYEAALEEGVVTYPILGCADGQRGDHILLAPPYIISSQEMEKIAQALEKAIARATA